MVRGNHDEGGPGSGNDEEATHDGTADGTGTAVCGLFVRGVAFGALAYLAGYVLVFVIALVERSGAGGNAWTMAGWLFYNAHFVGVEVPITGESVNVLAEAGSDGTPLTVPPVVYHLVPPAALTLAGYGAARSVPSSARTVTAAAGAGLAAGYLPLAAAGAFMFVLDLPQIGAAFRPDLTASVLLAGIAYPVAFGTAAGVACGASEDGRPGRQDPADRGADDGRRCGNCGGQVAGGDRFCRNCGTDLPTR